MDHVFLSFSYPPAPSTTRGSTPGSRHKQRLGGQPETPQRGRVESRNWARLSTPPLPSLSPLSSPLRAPLRAPCPRRGPEGVDIKAKYPPLRQRVLGTWKAWAGGPVGVRLGKGKQQLGREGSMDRCIRTNAKHGLTGWEARPAFLPCVKFHFVGGAGLPACLCHR